MCDVATFRFQNLDLMINKNNSVFVSHRALTSCVSEAIKVSSFLFRYSLLKNLVRMSALRTTEHVLSTVRWKQL